MSPTAFTASEPRGVDVETGCQYRKSALRDKKCWRNLGVGPSLHENKTFYGKVTQKKKKDSAVLPVKFQAARGDPFSSTEKKRPTKQRTCSKTARSTHAGEQKQDQEVPEAIQNPHSSRARS